MTANEREGGSFAPCMAAGQSRGSVCRMSHPVGLNRFCVVTPHSLWLHLTVQSPSSPRWCNSRTFQCCEPGTFSPSSPGPFVWVRLSALGSGVLCLSDMTGVPPRENRARHSDRTSFRETHTNQRPGGRSVTMRPPAARDGTPGYALPDGVTDLWQFGLQLQSCLSHTLAPQTHGGGGGRQEGRYYSGETLYLRTRPLAIRTARLLRDRPGIAGPGR
ncbi:hypothetical protein SKAU_G00048030 [Synaphobranchus kaupii]|uniref:Uncharacterized protein n=1 Tax=Synaphobranchus kaupii TaxID=118154 RepID=A0A9Q1J955_SYNKA|nr:hypothetical protein SKAU_G00048030 [Synaphobranchus kaupii]